MDKKPLKLNNLAKPNVLVADPIPEGSLEKLRETANVQVAYKLSKESLLERLKECEGLIVRSETNVSRELIESSSRLQVIARAGVGVDNIDVEAATRKGIVVINSPEGNTLAAAEHTMAMMLAAARKIPYAHASLLRGEWERSWFVGTELYGKTLGIVGLGKIGREVAARAESFKMHLLGYDPYVNENYAKELGVTLTSLEDLLQKSDFVTLHLPLNPETERLMNKEKLSRMKRGSILINCARGGLVDEQALCEALTLGPLAGAALDVFTKEPPKDSCLLKLNNVVLTPHLGASTEEAQQRVALDVAEQMAAVLQGKPARSPVNIPSLTVEKLRFFEPYLVLVEKMGLLLSQMCRSPIEKVELVYQGEISKEDPAVLTNAALKGLLEHELGESVNYINAPFLARSRGIKIQESRSLSSANYANQLSIHVHTSKKEHRSSGSVFENSQPRIVEIEGYSINLVPQGCKLMTWHIDKPGLVGRVGTILGTHDINIAEMQVGRDKARSRAVMVLSVDDPVPAGALQEIRALPGIEDAQVVLL